ncbi:hypothetical protein DPEC_G00007830 [Dallia pectoralis]|uniref:Uncharacterized protein n=1 Tax=Dallia pectoralis TaxID=75939 RepID=A0ACC2HKF3_DALPE|nr:hypothetical protein DPEC_G00007830 [Dallia pectoralis]
MAKATILWALLILLCQQMLVAGHVLGRPYPASDLVQLKNLLERFEETMALVNIAENHAVDYEGLNPESEPSQNYPGWDMAPEAPKRPVLSDIQQPTSDESYSGALSQRNWRKDLLMASRSKAVSGCFGGRMDRIGTSSGLGCSPKRSS